MSLLRKLFWPLVILALILLIGLAVLATSTPLVQQLLTANNPPAVISSTAWSALPTPVHQHTQWISFSSTAEIRDLAATDELLWAATSGGVAVWEQTNAGFATVKFTSEHGLPSNETTAITIDTAGHIWVGTARAGIGRYDGTNWTTYTTADGLASNTIQTLAVDTDETLLVATAAGLNRYRPIDDQWETIPRNFLSLGTHNIHDLHVGPEGVWTATDKGVELFQDGEWELFTTIDGLPDNNVRSVTRTADGRIWVATAGGLGMYDGIRWQTFDTSHGLLAADVQTVRFAADDHTVWLGYNSGRAGITHFTVTNNTPSAETVTGVDGHFFLDAPAILTTSDNTVWIGTSEGLFQRTPDTQTWRTVNDPSNLPSNRLADMLVVGEALWGRTPSGLTYFDGVAWLSQTAADGLTDMQPTTLTSDSAQQIWLAYETPHVGFNRLPAMDESWRFDQCTTTARGHTFASSIQEMVFTADGTGWLVAHDGVFRFTPLEQGDAHCEFLSNSEYGQPQAAAVSGETVLIITRRHVWQFTYEKGLEIVERWRNQGAQFRTVVRAPDGAFWLATDRVLIRYDGREWLEFPLPTQTFAGEVRDLAVDDNLTLWLATSTGLGFYDGRWERFTTADGLPSNDVLEVALTPDGRVWVVTGGGVGRYNPQ